MAAPETSPAAMRKTERRIVACSVEREGEKVEVSSDEEELCTVDRRQLASSLFCPWSDSATALSLWLCPVRLSRA